MASADVIIKQMRDRGVRLAAEGDNVLFAPSGILSDQDKDALRRNKGAILAALYRERFEAGVLKAMEPSDPRIQNLEAEVEAKGHVLIWSNVLEDLIAFCRSSEDAENVPRGVVAYTADELAMLFPEKVDGISEDGLRLIHRAKQLGSGGVVEISNDD